MQIDFILLLRVKCERKEMDVGKSVKKEPGLDDLGNSVFLKMLKLEELMSGKRALVRKPKVWLSSLLLVQPKTFR